MSEIYRGHAPAPVPKRPIDPELEWWARWREKYEIAEAESRRRAERVHYRDGVLWGLAISLVVLYFCLCAASAQGG